MRNPEETKKPGHISQRDPVDMVNRKSVHKYNVYFSITTYSNPFMELCGDFDTQSNWRSFILFVFHQRNRL